ncbi:g4219 [Coccomyxa viridis]|uniref:G4219 protein n=1 Tax=Coccomyxa viridis TaxID=1274662 RepID=A0ABP1FPR6_9CHLO
MMYFDDFLLGFLVCAFISGVIAAAYLDYVRKEEALQRQQMAIEMVRDLDAAKLRHLLGSADLPPWIIFSDFEKAEWASQILAQLWPYLDSAVSDIGQRRLEQKLKERRARWMLDVAVEQFALGARAPQVSGVKVFKSAASGGADSDDVTIELQVLWGGNPDISLMIKPLPSFFNFVGFGPLNLGAFLQARVAVRNIIFNATVHLVLSPLLNSLPVVGAIQFAFATVPTLRFDLRLLGGNILNLAFVENWLREVFCSLLEPYTLPDKARRTRSPDAVLRAQIAHEFTPGVLRGLERPEGVLTVNLIEAINVPKADVCKWSDPYVVMYLSPHRKLKSTIANTTRHPVWNESFQLLVSSYRDDALTLLLYDHDRVTADERLGRADYPVRNIQDGQTRDLWLQMSEGTFCRPTDGTDEPRVQSVDQKSQHPVTGPLSKAINKARTGGLLRKKDKEPCTIHIRVQYFSFEGGVLERTLTATSLGAEAERAAQGRLVKAAHDGASVQPQPGQHEADEAAPDSREGPLADRPHRPRNQHDQALFDIITGGVLIIHIRDLEALKLPGTRCWKRFCLKRLQISVTVAGCTKTTGYIRLGPHMPDIILVKQEVEYQLTGDQIKRHREVIHVEVWDTLFPKTFLGEINIPLSHVVERMRLHGEWPLLGVRSGSMGLDMTYMSTLQRLRGRAPRRLGQTHGVQGPSAEVRHS